MNPVTLLKYAIKAVPAVRYALGLGGLLAVIAIAGSLGISYRVAVVGSILVVLGMLGLVLFASAVGLPGQKRNLPALVFTWFALIYFMAVSTVLFISVFFQYPIDLRYWLSEISPSSESITSPSSESIALPVGITAKRDSPNQLKLSVEIISSGKRKELFFLPEATLETVYKAFVNDAGLMNEASLGSPRYYRFNWVLVDKELVKEWRKLNWSQQMSASKYQDINFLGFSATKLLKRLPLCLENYSSGTYVL